MGYAIDPVAPGAGTLDSDDLSLAKDLLSTRERWQDQTTTKAFEDKFAQWNGSHFAVTFCSGRAALSACISALELKPEDEVIIPGYTCVVVPNAFRFAKVKVVCCDIELDTFGPDVNSLKQKVTKNTKAVLIQHLYGLVCRDILAILEFARSRGLYVIEDCAQSTGAEFMGTKVGNFGDLAMYSMDPSKPFSCTQGGIASTNVPHLAAGLEVIRNTAPELSHESVEQRLQSIMLNYYCTKDAERWWRRDWEMYRRGHLYHYGISPLEINGLKPPEYFCRLAPPLAAIADNQLRKLDNYNSVRRENSKRWDRWCAANGFKPASVLPDSQPIFLRYPVIVSPAMKANRRWAYRTLNVAPGVWFETHFHPAKVHLNDLPNASIAVAGCINFPTIF